MTTDSFSTAPQRPTTTPPGLRARLKNETRALHDQAERTGVMQRILRGRFVRTDYCELLRNLREIYAALEPALERHADHPLVAPIAFRGLFRLAHIERDLHDLHGPDWSDELEIKQAAAEYKQRLETLSATQPALLSAHAYVRYLGDMSGGQILARLVAQHLCAGDTGTSFYCFGSRADADLLIARFRAGLDAIPASPADADAIVAEGQRAFRSHIDLFEQLAA